MNILMFQEKNEKATRHISGVLAACEHCGHSRTFRKEQEPQ